MHHPILECSWYNIRYIVAIFIAIFVKFIDKIADTFYKKKVGEKMAKKNSKLPKKLLESQMLFRVTNSEKIRFKNKAKRMQTSPSKILRDFVRNSDKLQYLFSHEDAHQFTASLGRLNGQVNRMNYELNRINNHDGYFSSSTLDKTKDLLNDISNKYDEILTAIYGNIKPTKKAKNSLPPYASDYTKKYAKQLAEDKHKLDDAIANNADLEEIGMLQDWVQSSEDTLQTSLNDDKRLHNARK